MSISSRSANDRKEMDAPLRREINRIERIDMTNADATCQRTTYDFSFQCSRE